MKSLKKVICLANNNIWYTITDIKFIVIMLMLSFIIHDYMKELHDMFGCVSVINLDGGGSMGMYYKTKSMEFGLPQTTTQSVYEPYTATNYKTTQTSTIENIDLGAFQTTQTTQALPDYGNVLTTTSDYPVTNYGTTASTPITTTDEYTTTNYETTAIETTPTTTYDYAD